MNAFMILLSWILTAALSDTLSPDLCYSGSLKSCTPGGNECGSLGGLRDINGNYYSTPLCDTSLNGGGCVCNNVAGYNYYTCLPDVNGCTMCNASPQLADLDESPAVYPGFIAYDNGGYSMFYCINQEHDYSTFTTEVRVVGAYESSNGDTWTHTAGAATVNLRTCSGRMDLAKPVTLLLTSYEPIDWIIKSDDQYVIDNIDITDIQVWSYYSAQSSVTMNSSLSHITVTPQLKSASTLGFGYGSDSGGGSTAKLLNNIPSQLGDYAYSFIGQYSIDTVETCVGDQNLTIPTDQPTDTPTKTPTTATPTKMPTDTTTDTPTDTPTKAPTKIPTAPTTDTPTKSPTAPTTKTPTESTTTQTTKAVTTTDVNNCMGCDDQASVQSIEGYKKLGIVFALFVATII